VTFLAPPFTSLQTFTDQSGEYDLVSDPFDDTALLKVDVSAIVVAFKRRVELLTTLSRISAARPAPREILVHIDAGNLALAAEVLSAFSQVRLFVSNTCVGPGGGRGRLLRHARSPIVASFDDDSFPTSLDYFKRVVRKFKELPDAWVLDAAVDEPGRVGRPANAVDEFVGSFGGCGCAYRRDRVRSLLGYVPLPMAWGMEEVDLSLQIVDAGGCIVRTSHLRVFHDTDFGHYVSEEWTARSLINLCLLIYLRYPLILWPVGLLQVVSRVLWLTRHSRVRGIVSGLVAAPSEAIHHRQWISRVSPRSVYRWIRLRRSPAKIMGVHANVD
jgi:GT2 family glycosyltransferase